MESTKLKVYYCGGIPQIQGYCYQLSKKDGYYLVLVPKISEGFVVERKLSRLDDEEISKTAQEMKDELKWLQLDAVLQTGPVQIR